MKTPGKFLTKVITEESQVPAGFMRLTEIRQRIGDTNYYMLCKAQSSGYIPAVKLMRSVTDKMGPVWVSTQHADKFVADAEKMREAKKTGVFGSHPVQPDLPVEQVSPILNELKRIADAMERLERIWNGAPGQAVITPNS